MPCPGCRYFYHFYLCVLLLIYLSQVRSGVRVLNDSSEIMLGTGWKRSMLARALGM